MHLFRCSFGMVLYEIISGKQPYHGTSIPMLREAILSRYLPDDKLVDKKRNQLTPIETTIFVLVKNLMKCCWKQNTITRPKSEHG